MAFLVVAVAFAAIWRAGSTGKLMQLVVHAASHLFGGGDGLGSAKDILLF